jgi:hypothetical protein
MVNGLACNSYKVTSVPVLIHVHVDLRLFIEVRDNRAARGARRQVFQESLIYGGAF